MENIRTINKRNGVDIGYHESNLRPSDGEGCVGKSGIDKTFTLMNVIEIANRMNPRPNIIIKAGPRAKWYLKKFPRDKIEEEIEKQQWRDTSRATMWIIEWDN